MYWFFAHYFGFKPDEVDQLPYDRMMYFVELEQEFQKNKNKQLGL